MIPVPVGRTWSIRAVLLQACRVRCPHCGQTYWGLGLSILTGEAKGTLVASLFSEGDAPQRAQEALREKIAEVRQPLNRSSPRCPHCRRGETEGLRWLPNVTAGLIGLLTGGAAAIVLTPALGLPSLADLGIVVLALILGGSIGSIAFRRPLPPETDPLPENQAILTALPEAVYLERVRVMGGERAVVAWAQEADRLEPSSVTLVLPPWDTTAGTAGTPQG